MSKLLHSPAVSLTLTVISCVPVPPSLTFNSTLKPTRQIFYLSCWLLINDRKSRELQDCIYRTLATKLYPCPLVLISLQQEGWYSDKREQGMYWTSPVKCFIWQMLLSKIDLIGRCLIPLRQRASETWGLQLPQWRPLAEPLTHFNHCGPW